jgi:hypothetical protein
VRSHEPDRQSDISIEQLYPELTPEERQEAAYWLGRYLDLVRRIHERKHDLTGSDEADRI